MAKSEFLKAQSLVELFLFRSNTGQEWRFCTSEEPFSYLGQLFQPSSLKRSGLAQTADAFKSGITVSFARNDRFAAGLMVRPPKGVLTLTVFRAFWDEPVTNTTTVWRGRVNAIDIKGDQVDLTCEPILTALELPGLRARYQYGCRHALYGEQCGARRKFYPYNARISAVFAGEKSFQLAEINQDFVPRLAGGVAEIPTVETGVKYTILGAHPNGTIELLNPIYGLAEKGIGAQVIIQLGCDKTMAMCHEVHDNLANFGGFPYIPIRNPFDGSPIV